MIFKSVKNSASCEFLSNMFIVVYWIFNQQNFNNKLFVCVVVLCSSQYFFSHDEMRPPFLGYEELLWGVVCLAHDYNVVSVSHCTPDLLIWSRGYKTFFFMPNSAENEIQIVHIKFEMAQIN